MIHGSPSLGYVDAQHQSLGRVVGERLITAYWRSRTDRKRLLAMRWDDATQLILDDLRVVHPDLSERLQQVDIVRHGHAMAIPTPGLRSSAALAAIPDSAARVSFAHADLSAYSVFEEAFTHGASAGERAARALGRWLNCASNTSGPDCRTSVQSGADQRQQAVTSRDGRNAPPPSFSLKRRLYKVPRRSRRTRNRS